MKLYRLECLTEYGDIEVNGYFLDRDNAEMYKIELDSYRGNVKYGIKQNIVEIKTLD